MKEVPFVNGRYMKGVPFLPKMVYKRVRGQTSGRSLPVSIYIFFLFVFFGGGGCKTNVLVHIYGVGVWVSNLGQVG